MASIIAARPSPLSLTAAASRRIVKPGQPSLDIHQEGWQDRMWHFYDTLGCVHYGVQFKKNAASKVSYFAAERAADPNEEPQPTTNQQVIDAVARLKSRFGDINEIVAEFMVHINIPGEGYLVGNDGLEGEEWDVWSVEEIQKSQFGALLLLEPDRAITDDEGSYAARIWRPHPKNRHLADAPLRPVADQCEQLLLLEDSISALAKSRLSAGFWYVPSELDIGDQKAFEDELIAVLTTPIKETDSAARWAPGLLRGPAEFHDKVHPIGATREIDVTFAGMREELTRTIAAGLDLPAEIILGKADLNHWTGWDIDESAFRDHVGPDIILILDSITRGYLVPALTEARVPDPEKYLIWYDLSDLGQKPPTIAEAIELNAAGIVNDMYVRDLIGASDEDAPEEEPEPEIPPPELVPLPAVPGPPVQADQLIAAVRMRPLVELARIDRMLLERITEASEAGFNRVLERAGAKIRSHAKKDRGISATIDRVPNDQVTLTLGETLVRQLQITPQELVPDDSFDPLEKRLRVIMAGAQEEVALQLEQITGELPLPEPRTIQAAIAAFMATLSVFALRMLFKPQEPEPGEVGDTVIPAGMVVDMLTQAGGAAPVTGPSNVRGFATGQDSVEWITGHGIQVASHRWEYGDPSTRRRPFPPHKALDNVEFADWTDERLATPASASFLSVSHMFPGDHYRCQCLTTPVIVEAAA
jgi:hypothetical protein